MSDSTTLDTIDQYVAAVLELSVPLHASIAAFDEPDARYELAGAPGLALFERDGGDTISHVSNSPAPEFMAVLELLRERHRDAVGGLENTQNSHLDPLLLMMMCIVDEQTGKRWGLDVKARREVALFALDDEQAKHDPQIKPHDSALRAWVPLSAKHDQDAGVHTAVLEMHFFEKRSERYAPGWESQK